jgi:hypothetical protein
MFGYIARYFPEYALDDRNYLVERYVQEGIPFLYQRLPLFGKSLDQSVITETPWVLPQGFPRKRRTGLTRVFYELLTEFMTDEGLPRYRFLYDEPVPQRAILAYQCVRQVTLFWSKVRVESDYHAAEFLNDFEERLRTFPEIKS